MIFTRADYDRLATLFRPGYAGYRPTVREIPNGDGVVDEGKKYLHVSLKYDPPGWAVRLLVQAWAECQIQAQDLGCHSGSLPTLADSVLRVLYYPPGTGSAEHTDFDLCTLNCFREPDISFQVLHMGELGELIRLGPAMPHAVPALPVEQFSIVFFGIPRHDLVLPDGRTVGEYLNERISRSRMGVGT